MKFRAKDIAREVGVSPATVSLVINNKPGVGKEKRQEIIDKIIELNCEYLFVENNEKAERGKGSIGFVVFKGSGKIVEESPFFNYILEGINFKINKYGYVLIFIYINSNMTLEEQAEQLKNSGCKGFLIFGAEMQLDDLLVFKKTNLPFVVIDNSFQESDIDTVVINNVLGVSKAIEFLYKSGHRRIGYIKSRERINSFDERRYAFKKKMKELGLKELEKDILEISYSEHLIKKEVEEFFSKKGNDIATAYFAENDFLACNAMIGIQKAGYKIPEDISIIGFDNRPITEIFEPNLTTINVPKDIFGPEAVELLISRLEKGRKQSLKVIVGNELIDRNSVKKIEND